MYTAQSFVLNSFWPTGVITSDNLFIKTLRLTIEPIG